MAEPFLKRVQRIVSAGLESAADAAERANGTSMMRHAVREVEQSIDRLHERRTKAEQRRSQAEEQRKRAAERGARLEADARLALAKGREDLAEAAVTQQMELEAGLAALRQQERDAVAEAARIDTAIAELSLRKSEMAAELAAVEAARKTAQASGSDPKVDLKVKRAEAAFERARAAAGAHATVGSEPTSLAEAEIAALRREDAVAERLVAMKAASARKGRAKSR